MPAHLVLLACLFVTLGLLATRAASAAGEDFVVVVNEGVAIESISRSDLRAIYLGDMTRWKDGSAVAFAMLNDGSGVYRSFLHQATGKTPSQFTNYWRRLMFSGKGVVPHEFSDPLKLQQFIAATPGAVGYLPAATPLVSVKQISIK